MRPNRVPSLHADSVARCRSVPVRELETGVARNELSKLRCRGQFLGLSSKVSVTGQTSKVEAADNLPQSGPLAISNRDRFSQVLVAFIVVGAQASNRPVDGAEMYTTTPDRRRAGPPLKTFLRQLPVVGVLKGRERRSSVSVV